VETVRVPAKPVPLRVLLFARAVRRWGQEIPGWLLVSLERVPGVQVYRAGDGCHAEWLSRKGKIRPVARAFDRFRPLNRAYFFLERSMFTSDRLSAVIANSRGGKEEIICYYGVPGEKIAVIHNGVDVSEFPTDRREAAGRALRDRYNIPERDTVFLFVGSGFARKGVGVLVDAAVRLTRAGAPFRLIVIGKGDAERYLRKVREGGVEERIRFLGPVPGAREYFLGADAVGFPTIYEPFSNACLEAMAAGLPIVTTTVYGVSECLRDGESGYLLEDPMDAALLAGRMGALLSEPLRRGMGEAARWAAEACSQDRNVRETAALLVKAWEETVTGNLSGLV
jgi:UDP-glucose:(heptosyl)LPS alpha-1,3-glucosyltransferase